MESKQERQSHRMNLVEEKRLDKQLKLLTKSQKTVAMDIQNSQREMKRRLQRYRERQRDLIGEKISGPALTVEDILKKHQPRLTSHTPLRRQKKTRIRPATAPPPKIDMSVFLDLQKWKVDLRPMTASSRRHKPEVPLGPESNVSSTARGYRSVTGERLGTADMEARYFVDEELDERSAFYYDLTAWRKRTELSHFKEVNQKVMHFCGIKPRETLSAGKTKWKSVGLALKFKSVALADGKGGYTPPAPPNLIRFQRRKSSAAKSSVRGESSPVGPREAWVDYNRTGDARPASRATSRELSPTSPTRPKSAFH